MRLHTFWLLLCLAAPSLLISQSTTTTATTSSILSGPMPGYTTMNEVGIWMQLTGPGKVQLEYWNPESSEEHARSQVFEATSESAFTIHAIASDLEPGVRYNYNVWIDGREQSVGDQLSFHTQTLWQHRTDPPAFKVALGSCSYINEEGYDRPDEDYGGGYEIFDQIADQHPDMMLWLGDNIYLRERDWSSWSGYLHRYTHTRSLPEMQRLLRTAHHYAIWDDHDFGPNDANGSWIHKDWALESFKLFWMNPSFGLPDAKGITTAFRYTDMDFFLLDNRYNRTADDLKNGDEQLLGREQIEWLINALKYSNAPFKMIAVGGQVLNPAVKYENHAVYGEERAYLIQRIAEEEIPGVVFLSGDRHHSELTKLEAENGIVMYDLTVSPLTSGTHDPGDEGNTLQVENTLVNVRNFAILEFNGPREGRSMNISIFDSTGSVLWSQTIENK